MRARQAAAAKLSMMAVISAAVIGDGLAPAAARNLQEVNDLRHHEHRRGGMNPLVRAAQAGRNSSLPMRKKRSAFAWLMPIASTTMRPELALGEADVAIDDVGVTCPSSPDRRVTMAGSTMRLGKVTGPTASGSKACGLDGR